MNLIDSQLNQNIGDSASTISESKNKEKDALKSVRGSEDVMLDIDLSSTVGNLIQEDSNQMYYYITCRNLHFMMGFYHILQGLYHSWIGVVIISLNSSDKTSTITHPIGLSIWCFLLTPFFILFGWIQIRACRRLEDKGQIRSLWTCVAFAIIAFINFCLWYFFLSSVFIILSFFEILSILASSVILHTGKKIQKEKQCDPNYKVYKTGTNKWKNGLCCVGEIIDLITCQVKHQWKRYVPFIPCVMLYNNAASLARAKTVQQGFSEQNLHYQAKFAQNILLPCFLEFVCCGYLNRFEFRRMFGISGNLCSDCFEYCCCPCCSSYQILRENAKEEPQQQYQQQDQKQEQEEIKDESKDQ